MKRIVQERSGMRYRLIKKDDSLQLRYDKSDEAWCPSVRGKLASKLSCTGDGLVFHSEDETTSLNYSEAYQLMILLCEFYSEGSPKPLYEVFKLVKAVP